MLARLLAASRSPGLHVGIAFAMEISSGFFFTRCQSAFKISSKDFTGVQSVGGGLAAFDLWKANRAVPPVPEPELTHQGYRR